jgi:hypothetical protein
MRADLVALGGRLSGVAADDKEEPALAAVMERLRHEGEGCLVADVPADGHRLPSAAARIADAGSASCQLLPASRQLAPAPSRLCERALSCRFLDRCGSLLAVHGCVEAVLHPVLRL